MTDPELIASVITKMRDIRHQLLFKPDLHDGRMGTYDAACALDEALIRQHQQTAA